MRFTYRFKLWKLRFKKKRLQEISNLEADTLDIGILEMKNGEFLYKTKMAGWNVTVILDILKREFFYIEDGIKQTVPINIQELLLDRLIQRV